MSKKSNEQCDKIIQTLSEGILNNFVLSNSYKEELLSKTSKLVEKAYAELLCVKMMVNKKVVLDDERLLNAVEKFSACIISSTDGKLDAYLNGENITDTEAPSHTIERLQRTYIGIDLVSDLGLTGDLNNLDY